MLFNILINYNLFIHAIKLRLYTQIGCIVAGLLRQYEFTNLNLLNDHPARNNCILIPSAANQWSWARQ
jgi:hypothetical protein